MRRAWVRRARHWIANRGWGGFLREVVRRGGLMLKRDEHALGAQEAAQPVHPFDEEHGVETGGLIHGEALDVEPARAYWATAYYGIAPSVFTAALDRLALDWTRFAYVDVGCGKGRALMLATRYPFRAAMGLELSPELARVAEANLQRFRAEWRQAMPVRVVCGDATEMELPQGPLVLTLYHPFAAPVMRRFLHRVEQSLRTEPREVWVLYANPELDPMLSATPWLRREWEECFGMSGADRAADRFGSTWEKMVAYRAV